MIDYTFLYKTELSLDGIWPAENQWDVFVSAFTAAERVHRVYNMVSANSKHWMVCPEYRFSVGDLPAGAFVCNSSDEAEYINEFWDTEVGDVSGKTFAIDITGFIRPYLIFLLKWLMEKGVKRFDALYTEPNIYGKREQTKFSDESVVEIRQVAGFEGNHYPDTSNDYLIIGAGYDHQLIAQVAESKEPSRKLQIFGLPSLRADMYQENVLRSYRAVEAVGGGAGDESASFFAPANDPFVTASVLRGIVHKISKSKPYTNLYLSPLSTKPQVLGFALYYLTECLNSPVSLIFPFCQSYNPETTMGMSRIWKYTVELPGS